MPYPAKYRGSTGGCSTGRPACSRAVHSRKSSIDRVAHWHTGASKGRLSGNKNTCRAPDSCPARLSTVQATVPAPRMAASCRAAQVFSVSSRLLISATSAV